MTPQELKNSILQLAIQGKLVKQHSEEGTAEELYRQIQAEKQALIKAGKIKKEKPLPEITEDEIPFDIPESWKWVRLRSIVFNRGQETPSEEFCYIDIGSLDNKRQCLNEAETIIAPENAPSRARKLVEFGDILYSTVRPYLHNMCIIDRSFSHKPIASTGFAAMACHAGVNNKYLLYYLMSPSFDLYANNTENAKGVAYPAINDDRLYRALIVLPPLAEQKRIVAKIEELLPLIERYEKAWSRLEDFNKRFPGDMQKSILQMAIQGKLVKQHYEEGTGEELYKQIQAEKQTLIKAGKIKKEKPLPEITDDEIPFDIPENWVASRLGEICYKITDGTHKTPRYTSEGIRFVSAKDLYSGKLSFDQCKYISEEEHAELYKRCNPERGDLLISKSGSIGTVTTINVDFAFSLFESLALVKYEQTAILPEYLKYAVQCACFHLSDDNVRGVAVKHLPIASICSLVIPLPPLAEQKRIVARLEELLPLCERLK